jgi:hypothetical protein
LAASLDNYFNQLRTAFAFISPPFGDTYGFRIDYHNCGGPGFSEIWTHPGLIFCLATPNNGAVQMCIE